MDEVLSGSTSAWSESESKLLRSTSRTIWCTSSASPLTLLLGASMTFFHKAWESLSPHGLQEVEGHQSEEPALVSYSEML